MKALNTNVHSRCNLGLGLPMVVIHLESSEIFVPALVNMDGMLRLASMAAIETAPQKSSHREPDAATLYRSKLQFSGFADWIGSFRPISME